MSAKSFIYALITVIVLMTVSFFAGRWSKPDQQEERPDVQTVQYDKDGADSAVFIKSDTSFIPVQVNIRTIQNIKLNEKLNLINKVYTLYFDSLVAIKNDSIKTVTKVEFNMDMKNLNIDQQISYRKYERLIIDTIIIRKTEIRKIAAPSPFYNTFGFGFITGIILFILGLLAW